MTGEHHDPKTGRFLPGNNAGPNGGVGKNPGYQPYGKRAAYLLSIYSNEELVAIYNDKSRFGKLPVFDSMIVANLVNAIYGKSAGEERERLLNRIEGQPKATTVNMNVDGKLSEEEYAEAKRALLSGIIREPTEGGTGS